MDVLRWWFESVPAWFWHHATHIDLGSLGGTWIGWLFTGAVWGGETVLFAGYALVTLGGTGYLLVGVAKALRHTGRSFMAGYRKNAQR